jgi:hypothetical protein
MVITGKMQPSPLGASSNPWTTGRARSWRTERRRPPPPRPASAVPSPEAATRGGAGGLPRRRGVEASGAPMRPRPNPTPAAAPRAKKPGRLCDLRPGRRLHWLGGRRRCGREAPRCGVPSASDGSGFERPGWPRRWPAGPQPLPISSASEASNRRAPKSGLGGPALTARRRMASRRGSLIATQSNSSQSHSPPVPSTKLRRKPATSSGVRSTVRLPRNRCTISAIGSAMGVSNTAAQPWIPRPDVRRIAAHCRSGRRLNTPRRRDRFWV